MGTSEAQVVLRFRVQGRVFVGFSVSWRDKCRRLLYVGFKTLNPKPRGCESGGGIGGFA